MIFSYLPFPLLGVNKIKDCGKMKQTKRLSLARSLWQRTYYKIRICCKVKFILGSAGNDICSGPNSVLFAVSECLFWEYSSIAYLSNESTSEPKVWEKGSVGFFKSENLKKWSNFNNSIDSSFQKLLLVLQQYKENSFNISFKTVFIRIFG